MAEKKRKNISLDNLEKFKENLDKDISKHKTLTQAEYDALTEVEKNNGTFYFIEDGNSAVTDSDKDYIDSQDQQTLNSAKAFTTDTIQNYYAKTEVDTLLNTKADMEEATSTKAGMFSATNKVKLDGIEDGAQVNTVTGIKGSAETTYRTGEVNITSENIGLENVENKSSETIRGEITKSNVTNALGFTPPTAEEALTSAKGYTDTKIADLINGAPATLDTLGEIAQAMSDNKDVVDALDDAIGTKATTSDLTTHTNNTSNPHNVTKAQVGLGNVENKSSTTIRGELTKSDVTTALGYTPPTSDTIYTLPTATSSVLGGVKIGDNITNTDGTISITKDNVTTALGYTPPSKSLFTPLPELKKSIGQSGLTFIIPQGAYLMFYSAYSGMFGFIISRHGDSAQLHKLGNTLGVTVKNVTENGTPQIEVYVPGQLSGICYFYSISLG